jgi:hypothetical protein
MFAKKINHREMAQKAVIAGFIEAAYIFCVAGFFLASSIIFGGQQQGPGIIISVMSFLILFVISASVSGLLMLGYPIYYALQKQFKEALICLVSSIGSLVVVFIVLAFISIFIF